FFGRSAFCPKSLLPVAGVWKAKAVAALASLGIYDYEKRTGLLSGGERQRVAAARALVSDWRILFADEPISQLDETNARLVIEALRAAARERNAALLLVLHHQGLAREFADRFLDVTDTGNWTTQ